MCFFCKNNGNIYYWNRGVIKELYVKILEKKKLNPYQTKSK